MILGKAAKTEDSESDFLLGMQFLNDKNYKKAIPLLERAVNQGHANAQCALGMCYDYGWGVEQDYKKAVDWYERAVLQGNAP